MQSDELESRRRFRGTFRRRWRFYIIAITLLVAATILVVRIFRDGGSGQLPAQSNPAAGSGGVASPSSILDDPLQFSGVKPSDANRNPGGVSPPQGARLISSTTVNSYKTTAEYGNYESELSPEQILAYYRAIMARKGFKEISDKDRDGQRLIIFAKSDEQFSLKLLPKKGKEAKMFRYTVLSSLSER